MMLAVIFATFLGRVVDRTTGQPLAHVRVEAAGVRTQTDARGRFALRGLHPGAVTITLESDDVPKQRLTVQVRRGVAQRDLRACSTTLDFRCGDPQPGAPGGSGGAG